jgi:hypothetical protein
MTTQVYENFLSVQLCAGWYLTDDANTYIYLHLDPDDETAVRHVLRHLVVPVYGACDDQMRAHVKAALQWFINCGDNNLLTGLIDSNPDWPVEYASDPRLTYIWWWQELFGEEPWRSFDICAAELVSGNPPPEAGGTNTWSPPIDEAVLLFRRRDGLPPGTDAPPVNKPLRRR